MAFLSLAPAPVGEPIATDEKGEALNLYVRWLPWFSKLWDVINALAPSVGEDVGDADVTLYVRGVNAPGTLARASAKTQIYNSPLTAPRTITLSTINAHNGAAFHIVRTAAATGASGLSVGGLTTLAVGEWCTVTMSSTAWMLTAKGSL